MDPTAHDDDILITPLSERPALITRIYEIDNTWPPFVPHDLVGNALVGRVPGEFPAYCVVATDADRVVARGLAVPFDGTTEGRETTPDQGWDRVLSWAFLDHWGGRAVSAVSALEIVVDRAYLGRGLSYRMLEALRNAAAQQGHDMLFAPVRPTAKHPHPHVPMAAYIGRRRDDGLPEDPWLRAHVRSGGTIEKVAPASMTVTGSLAQWREWTGLPFDRDGDTEVPGALAPVRCELAHDLAVYVEPNVWVRHRTDRRLP